jgi:Flp pilus assembly protein TadD
LEGFQSTSTNAIPETGRADKDKGELFFVKLTIMAKKGLDVMPYAGYQHERELLLDQGKSGDAVALLESVTGKTSSPTLLDLLGDAYTQTKDLAKAETAYRKAVEIDPSELSHQRGLGQTLLSEEKYPEALKVYQRLADLMPDDSDVYLRIAQIYRELHQLDKAEETLTKARQFAPGSLDVMYNEAMLYQAQGRNEDAIRVLSEAVTGVKNQSEVLPTRRRTLAVLYQQLGQLYRTTENYQAAIYTYEELGRLGDDEDRRARLLLMETFRTAKDLPRPSPPRPPQRSWPKDRPSRFIGECGLPDDGGEPACGPDASQPAASINPVQNFDNIFVRFRVSAGLY